MKYVTLSSDSDMHSQVCMDTSCMHGHIPVASLFYVSCTPRTFILKKKVSEMRVGMLL